MLQTKRETHFKKVKKANENNNAMIIKMVVVQELHDSNRSYDNQ